MSTNLFGFSTKSFEQFAQTLAVHVIGPGISVFGSGPDGGREATFEGEIGYPFDAGRWNGYGILQAKYKEKTEGTDLDQRWALEQLNDELKLFVESANRKKKPEYFIFVTNVTLTPVATSGGKDKAEKLILSYYDKLPIKGHRIWDGDQITIFLQAYEELRRSFSVHLTPGDVMARLADAIEQLQPDFTDVATTFLIRQLRDDEDARLDQAGQRIDQRTALAKVFVDLPAVPQPSENPPDEGTDFLRGFLRELVDSGSKKLDAKSRNDSKREIIPNLSTSSIDTSRWVLIGGPGSGKSTLSQFLAQLHRASILSRRPEHVLAPEVHTIIIQIRALCDLDKIPWPSTPRFPFRVELSSFAKSLAANNEREKTKSLLGYLATRMQGDRQVSVENLLLWLSRYPSLLILDGLDEVPASSNRDEVCRAIQDFLAETSLVNADLLTLATTRPAGYKEEFGKETFEYRYLLPLSIKRSLLYAKRFAEARFGIHSSRVNEMTQRLSEASCDDLTARLMRTPLQVTFMATLIAAGGRPPRDRWKLFRDYYDTIYKREQQKSDGDLREVLDNQDTLVHRVHHDVGFLLQVHGENAGATDATMSLASFSNLVEIYLKEEGWDETEFKKITTCISEEARTRLVFLTSRVADQISFDVRSLQEYMASECIMTGAENRFHLRMRTIAPLPYWRNVFLFTAGKCFADSQIHHLRPTVRQICEELNDVENDALFGAVKSGSRLAVDLLEDGTAINTPNFARSFARIALELLQFSTNDERVDPRPQLAVRLTKVYDAKLDEVYKLSLLSYLGKDKALNVQAWGIIIGLIGRKIKWALELAEQSWPDELQDQIKILAFAQAGNINNPWFQAKLKIVVPQSKPNQIIIYDAYSTNADLPAWLKTALILPLVVAGESASFFRLNGDGKAGINLTFNAAFTSSVQNKLDMFLPLRDMPTASSSWLPYIVTAKFLIDPTKENLADQLAYLSEHTTVEDLKQANGLAWPIQACIDAAIAGSDLKKLSSRVRFGEAGNTENWQAAERRWIETGLSIRDIQYRGDVSLPFDSSIATIGIPAVASLRWPEPNIPRADIIESLLKIIADEEDTNLLGNLRFFVFFALIARRFHEQPVQAAITPAMWNDIWMEKHDLHFNIFAITELEWKEKLEDGWIEFFELLGNSECELLPFHGQIRKSIVLEQIIAAYISNPDLHGLLRVLATFAVSGEKTPIPRRLLNTTRFNTNKGCLSALLLRINQADFDDIDTLVDMLVRIQNEESKLKAIELSIHIATQLSQEHFPAVERFILAVRAKASSYGNLLTSACNNALLIMLSRRNSGLSQRSYAEELNLPFMDFERPAQTDFVLESGI